MIFALISCEDAPVHEHAYEWKYDANNHWKVCSCGETSAKEVHTYGNVTVVDGKAFKTCTACGKKIDFTLATVATEEEVNKALKEEKQVIVFSEDIKLSQSLNVKKDLIIDLNGKTISSDKQVFIADGAKLTINGKGNVVSEHSAAVQAINEGTVIVNGGSYDGDFGIAAGTTDNNSSTPGFVIINDATVTAKEFALPVWGASKLIVNGGVFTANDNAVIGTNGSKFLSETPFEIIINKGTFNGKITTEGYIACGIYIANTGSVVLNGGEFNIEGGVGILLRSGNLTANAVTVNLTEKEGLESGKVGDSQVVITTKSQIVVDDRAGYPGDKPTVVKNSTSYILKNINGEAYTK